MLAPDALHHPLDGSDYWKCKHDQEKCADHDKSRNIDLVKNIHGMIHWFRSELDRVR